MSILPENHHIRSLHQNPYCPNFPKNANKIDLSQYSYSICSVSIGLISFIKVVVKKSTLLKKTWLKIYWIPFFQQNPDSSKYWKLSFSWVFSIFIIKLLRKYKLDFLSQGFNRTISTCAREPIWEVIYCVFRIRNLIIRILQNESLVLIY